MIISYLLRMIMMRMVLMRMKISLMIMIRNWSARGGSSGANDDVDDEHNDNESPQ